MWRENWVRWGTCLLDVLSLTFASWERAASFLFHLTICICMAFFLRQDNALRRRDRNDLADGFITDWQLQSLSHLHSANARRDLTKLTGLLENSIAKLKMSDLQRLLLFVFFFLPPNLSPPCSCLHWQVESRWKTGVYLKKGRRL